MHSPEATELRREASRRGGHNWSAKARAAKLIPDPLTASELAGYLSRFFVDVVTGRAEFFAHAGIACQATVR